MERRRDSSPQSTEPTTKSLADSTSHAPFPFDKAESDAAAPAGQNRLLAMVAAGLLMVGVIVAAALLSSVTPRWGELVKILAVVMFVGSMIALALAMVGDAYNRR